jgi:hypothetical protein
VQSEFDGHAAARAFAAVLAFTQATYSFAPSVFATLLPAGAYRTGGGTSVFFLVAALLQTAAACAIAWQRRL